MALYRHEAKTHNRYHLGASFDLGFTRIKKELGAPRPKNRFLVKFGFSVKIHLYHPKGGLHWNAGGASRMRAIMRIQGRSIIVQEHQRAAS